MKQKCNSAIFVGLALATSTAVFMSGCGAGRSEPPPKIVAADEHGAIVWQGHELIGYDRTSRVVWRENLKFDQPLNDPGCLASCPDAFVNFPISIYPDGVDARVEPQTPRAVFHEGGKRTVQSIGIDPNEIPNAMVNWAESSTTFIAGADNGIIEPSSGEIPMLFHEAGQEPLAASFDGLSTFLLVAPEGRTAAVFVADNAEGDGHVRWFSRDSRGWHERKGTARVTSKKLGIARPTLCMTDDGSSLYVAMPQRIVRIRPGSSRAMIVRRPSRELAGIPIRGCPPGTSGFKRDPSKLVRLDRQGKPVWGDSNGPSSSLGR